jgi:hypothetical protein
MRHSARRPDTPVKGRNPRHKNRIAFSAEICSCEHMNEPHPIPPSVADCLAEIERSVQRFRSSYSLGVDPERLLTDEIITMRVELIRLWSEICCKREMR